MEMPAESVGIARSHLSGHDTGQHGDQARVLCERVDDVAVIEPSQPQFLFFRGLDAHDAGGGEQFTVLVGAMLG